MLDPARWYVTLAIFANISAVFLYDYVTMIYPIPGINKE